MSEEVNEKIPFFQDAEKRAIVYQIALVVGLTIVITILMTTLMGNMEKVGMVGGFEFLSKEASFEIGESVIPVSAADPYTRLFMAGFFNTLKIAILGTVFALILGTIVGVGCLSSNWLVKKTCYWFVEIQQGVPLLLLLFMFHTLLYTIFPSGANALNPVSGVYLSNRGIFYPVPAENPANLWIVIAFFVGIIGAYFFRKWAKSVQEKTGRIYPVIRICAAITFGVPLLTWLLFGAPTEMDIPVLTGFNFEGGGTITPEFTALLIGLVLYTSAFVAEVVRAGILSVSKGQHEAALSLGLKPTFVVNLVILPQALRVIVPPLTSQILNLVKNSSLAIAIGYPDFVAVSNTTMNQTGQSLEPIALIMIHYLAFSLSTSLFMNWYNKRVKLVER